MGYTCAADLRMPTVALCRDPRPFCRSIWEQSRPLGWAIILIVCCIPGMYRMVFWSHIDNKLMWCILSTSIHHACEAAPHWCVVGEGRYNYNSVVWVRSRLTLVFVFWRALPIRSYVMKCILTHTPSIHHVTLLLQLHLLYGLEGPCLQHHLANKTRATPLLSDGWRLAFRPSELFFGN